MPTPADYMTLDQTTSAVVSMLQADGWVCHRVEKPKGASNTHPAAPTLIAHRGATVVGVAVETSDKSRKPLAAGVQAWADALKAHGVQVVRVCPSNLWDAVARLREIGAGQ